MTTLVVVRKNGKIAIAPVSQAIWEFCRQVAVVGAQKTVSLTGFVFGAIAQMVVASLDTGWEMVLGGVGGSAGAIGGLVLGYASPIGPEVASFVNEGLHQLIPNMTFAVGPEVLLFGFAGFGTAIGLTRGIWRFDDLVRLVCRRRDYQSLSRCAIGGRMGP